MIRVRLRDEDKVRVVGIELALGPLSTVIFNTHFDDPQTVMQMQTVDERVINYWPRWSFGSRPYQSVVVGSGRW